MEENLPKNDKNPFKSNNDFNLNINKKHKH